MNGGFQGVVSGGRTAALRAITAKDVAVLKLAASSQNTVFTPLRCQTAYAIRT